MKGNWPEGPNPDPEKYPVEMIVERFWELRPDGRKYQSLREDASMYLIGWVAVAGKENVIEAYHQIMEMEQEDLDLGGKPHTSDTLLDWLLGRWKPPKDSGEGGLKVYV